jgi:hypothetical protein
MGKSLSDHRSGRSKVAIDAHFRTGAGAMGGGKRRRNRKDRAQSRQNLRRGDWS